MNGKGGYTRKRIDGNQPQIFEDAQKDGIDPISTAMVGHGFPDAIFPYRGQNFLFEIKQSGKKLTTDEEKWHAKWKAAGGQVDVIESYQQAKEIMEKETNVTAE